MLDFKLAEKLICRMAFIQLKISVLWFTKIETKKMFRTSLFFLIIRIIEFIVENLEKIMKKQIKPIHSFTE